ncbi:ACP S-malonyltransferase [Streptomyces sp. NPDC056161]|uniref:ACP S-malonyltransferase n=1 Tax=Streptomyces sp. NPDC056161 TaxID=3345732 RepID=UPI0035DE2F79
MVTAFMFPGAGSSYADPFAHYPPGRRIAAELADRVDAVSASYGWPTVRTEPDRTRTSWDQASELRTYHFQLCCLRILDEEFGLRPDVVVGHSLGEITALVAAGGLTVEDGALLLCERARALRLHARPTGATAAFMLSAAEAEDFARSARDVVVAAVNGPSQVILSGPAEQLRLLLSAADSRGILATTLRTGPYPQHHPCLGAARTRYLDAVRAVPQGAPRIPVDSPVLGRRLRAGDDLIAVTAAQLTHPLDFAQAVTRLLAAGVDRFVECGLKDTLSQFVAEIAGDTVHTWAPFRKRLTDNDVRRHLKE